MPHIAFDLDTLEDIDALYLIHKLAEHLRDPDPITAALAKVAYDIADTSNPCAGYQRVFDYADDLYPQTEGIWTADDLHRINSKVNAHLRRFGLMTGDRT